MVTHSEQSAKDNEIRDLTKDRSIAVSVETSIEYLKSDCKTIILLKIIFIISLLHVIYIA